MATPSLTSLMTAPVDSEATPSALPLELPRLRNKDTIIAVDKPMYQTHKTPPEFAFLPTELRLRIYNHYFEDAKLAGAIDQPQASNVAALLLVCRQVYDEAADIVYKKATLVLHVSRDYHSQPVLSIHSYLNDLGLGRTIDEVCATPCEIVRRFKKVNLVTHRPSQQHSADHWEHMWRIIVTISHFPDSGQHFTMELNLGCLEDIVFEKDPLRTVLHHKNILNRADFTPMNVRPINVGSADYQDLQDRASSYSRFLYSLPARVREWYCITGVICQVVREARMGGHQARLVCGSRVKDVMAAKSMMEVMQMAKEVAEEGVDIWLMSEGPGMAEVFGHGWAVSTGPA